MASVTLRGHFDGKQILLDEPYNLQANDRLLVTVMSKEIEARENKDWITIAESALNRAYSDDEPEYDLSMIKEPNPKYESR